MKDIKTRILSNREIGQGYFRILLDAPGIARDARPGQFVQVRCSDSLDPLLRRPFSIHSLKNGVEILYEVVGRGTGLLSRKKKGEFIDVLGPLGNGFTLAKNQSKAILVAGGIGVAPLIFLAEELARRKIKAIVLIGTKTKKLILCDKDFKKSGAEVHIATDDGTSGHKGFVSELFEKVLGTTNNEQRTVICACGPHAMLQCIADICKDRGLDCQVSLEERMACGFGVCLSCAIKVKGGTGYKLACKDGPVFNAAQLIWH